MDSLNITITGRLDDREEIVYALRRLTEVVEFEGIGAVVGAKVWDSNGNSIGTVEAAEAAPVMSRPSLTSGRVPRAMSPGTVEPFAAEITRLHATDRRDDAERANGIIRALEMIMGTDEARRALSFWDIDV